MSESGSLASFGLPPTALRNQNANSFWRRHGGTPQEPRRTAQADSVPIAAFGREPGDGRPSSTWATRAWTDRRMPNVFKKSKQVLRKCNQAGGTRQHQAGY